MQEDDLAKILPVEQVYLHQYEQVQVQEPSPVENASPVAESLPVVESGPGTDPPSIDDPKPDREPPPVKDPPSIDDPEPFVDPQPVKDPPSIDEPKPVEDPQPVNDPPSIDEPKPVENPQPVNDPPSIDEPKPVEAPQPVNDPPSIDEPKPVADPQPIDETKSVEDIQVPQPVREAPAAQAQIPVSAFQPQYPVRIHSRLQQQMPLSDSAEQVYEIQPFQEPPVDKEQQYIEQQEAALVQRQEPAVLPAKPCRHEYVRIFQRKLKDLNRRMVCTKAYLPVGFKMGDFGHLGENSFCFCATCRARLYPKRSQAEKAEARLQLAQGKALKLEQSLLSADLIEEVGSKALAELLMRVDDDDDDERDEVDDANVPKVDIHVEELEPEVIGVEDLNVDGLKANQEEESCELLDQEEM